MILCAIWRGCYSRFPCSLLRGPWVPFLPPHISFLKAQPMLNSGLRYLRMQRFALHFQAACIGKGKWPSSPHPFTAWFLGCIQSTYSLNTFEGFVSVLPIDPCTGGLFCVCTYYFFFQKRKSACGIEIVLTCSMRAHSRSAFAMCHWVSVCQPISMGRQDLVYGLQLSTL